MVPGAGDEVICVFTQSSNFVCTCMWLFKVHMTLYADLIVWLLFALLHTR